MPRVRLAVALLVPAPADAEIEGLRRACGDPALARVAPHLTLVPPVNVRAELLPDALRVLRSAAGEVRPFTLRLGPVASFAPVSPTLHLVADDDPASPGGAAAVVRLHERCLAGPLDRRIDHDFVPHVTVAQQADPERIAAGLVALDAYRASIAIDRVHLLVEREADIDRPRRWVPLADAPLGPVHVVGRGGLALELTATTLVDPEAQALLHGSPAPRSDGALSGDGLPEGAQPLVITARHDGRAVAVLVGWTRDGEAIEHVCATAPEEAWRPSDLGDHLRALFSSIAAERAGARGPG